MGHQKHMDSNSIILKPTKTGMILLRIVLNIPVVIWLFAMFVKGFNKEGVFVITLVLLFYIVIEYGMQNSFFKNTNGLIEYRHFYGKVYRIRLEDIEACWVEIGLKSGGGLTRIVVEPKKKSGISKFFISISAYDHDDYLKMIRMLPMKEMKSEDKVEELIKRIYLKYK